MVKYREIFQVYDNSHYRSFYSRLIRIGCVHHRPLPLGIAEIARILTIQNEFIHGVSHGCFLCLWNGSQILHHLQFLNKGLSVLDPIRESAPIHLPDRFWSSGR